MRTRPGPIGAGAAALATALLTASAVLLASPAGGTVTSGELSFGGAACPSTTDCVAVGTLDLNTGASAYSQTWNGKSWTVRKVKVPTGTTTSGLTAVACPTTKFCMAGGTSTAASDQKALVELWNGKAWSPTTAPVPKGGTEVELGGVACISASDCTVVGKYDSTKGFETFAARWSHAKWTVTLEPRPSGGQYPTLEGVACTTTPTCLAIGYYSGPAPDYAEEALGYAWNGKAWKPANPTTPTSSSSLAADACASATNCVTVGTFAESWNGKSWAPRTLPLAKGASRDALDSVACATTKFCMAVGASDVSVNGTAYLTESWNGTKWTIRSVPEPTGGMVDNLFGVTCASAKSCVAVGSFATEISSSSPLAETVEAWNGTKWSTKA